MFTGIIEEVGQVKEISPTDGGTRITVHCKKVLEDSSVGVSISIDGCCQTIVDLDESSFSVVAVPETLRRTNFEELQRGSRVNLERSLAASGRLSGHFVQGHVDEVGSITKVQAGRDDVRYWFSVSDAMRGYVVPKGSIEINGVSLTVVEVRNTQLSVVLIPHTIENTTFQHLGPHSRVNIEVDIIAKYIVKQLCDYSGSMVLGAAEERLKKPLYS